MGGTSPRITIGLPVYNGERFLEKTLECLLGQTVANSELIISDNASTDHTEDICQTWASKDRRIRYYRNVENLGAANNYRRVFELSHGTFFKWAAADDLCAPDYLARCVDILDSDPSVVLAYAKTRFIDDGGNPLDIQDPGWALQSEQPHERLRYVIFGGHWVNAIFGLIRSAALSKTRLVAHYRGGDYRLLGELSLLGKFFEVPDYLYFRRIHSNASSRHAHDQHWMEQFYSGNSSRISLPIWNRSIDHFTTILRSELTLPQKAGLVRDLLRSMRWQRPRLLGELKRGLNVYIHRSPVLRRITRNVILLTTSAFTT